MALVSLMITFNVVYSLHDIFIKFMTLNKYIFSNIIKSSEKSNVCS